MNMKRFLSIFIPITLCSLWIIWPLFRYKEKQQQIEQAEQNIDKESLLFDHYFDLKIIPHVQLIRKEIEKNERFLKILCRRDMLEQKGQILLKELLQMSLSEYALGKHPLFWGLYSTDEKGSDNV
jgi:hypothetical protein